MKSLEYIVRERKKEKKEMDFVAPFRAAGVRKFHKTIPVYQETPLISLEGISKELGVSKVWIKDESKRFGLHAFKGLGGSYAIAACLAKMLGKSINEMTFEQLCAPEAKEKLGTLTFVTATDGNHGRGVAWAARLFGHKAVVYMPKGSSQERLSNIRAQGAQAEITPYTYDDAVRLAKKMAEEHGWILVQDTAWEGYEEIPSYIMQGYTTMAEEIREQLKEERPTHLFLQAGVGSFAGAMLGYFVQLFGADYPTTVIMEPDKACCHYDTVKADDGKLHFSTGPMDSMMAGLCCGEPCTLSFHIIDTYADAFVSCSDEYSADGMRLLGNPERKEEIVVSGESGAVGAGVLAGIMKEKNLKELRDQLKLGKDSKVLLISTEGDTDQENYKRILNQIQAGS